MPASTGTFDPSVHVDTAEGRRVLRKRRLLYAVSTTLLSVLVALAVAEGVGLADIYGVQSTHVRAAAAGYELEVQYGTVSRPGLATPLDIEVRRPGGFDGPVRVAVDSHYLAMWDENGLDPDPASSTADDRAVIWEFDPPARGDVLVVSFDGRIEPAIQRGRSGRVAVVDEDGGELVAVELTTRIWP